MSSRGNTLRKLLVKYLEIVHLNLSDCIHYFQINTLGPSLPIVQWKSLGEFSKGPRISRLRFNTENSTVAGKTTKQPEHFSTNWPSVVLSRGSGNVHAGIQIIVGAGPQRRLPRDGGGGPRGGSAIRPRRSRDSNTLLANITPTYPVAESPAVIVRVEEVLLVVLVLVIWVAAIALFFNRWGKIRMLEPYQPKFMQQPHRPSCPLAPLSPPGIVNQVSLNNTLPRTQKPNTARMSFSKYNVNALTDPLSALPSPIIRRPRQNSVFVGSSTIAMLNPPPRRSKSAIDIQHLVVNEPSPTASLKGNRKGSIIPILNRERRPSLITIERPPLFNSRHRPSITIERPLISHHQYRPRRSSCFVDRPQTSRHRNFTSFEQHERRASSMDKPSCSYQPSLSEIPMESMELPLLQPSGSKPKISRSFEQPSKDKPKPERMANSLDVSSFSYERRSSIPEEAREPHIYINLEDLKITAPLLESLKSSDV